MWRNSVEPDTTDDKYGARTVRQFVWVFYDDSDDSFLKA
jgi:hypothetical protein